MAIELNEDKKKFANRTVNIAAILVGIVGMGCVAVCALISGGINLKLDISIWWKLVGVLSIVQGIVKFVDMGIFVEKIAKRPYVIDDEDENIVKNILDMLTGWGFLLSGIINIKLGGSSWMRELGIVAGALGGVSVLVSCCSMVAPIISDGQINSDILEDNTEEDIKKNEIGLQMEAVELSKDQNKNKDNITKGKAMVETITSLTDQNNKDNINININLILPTLEQPMKEQVASNKELTNETSNVSLTGISKNTIIS